jgi:hypothetical protein
MKVDFIQEPEPEFGSNGRHIDIRFGLMNYGPLDRDLQTAPEQIRIGVVGSGESVEGFTGWIAACREGVDAKVSKQPNLFPRFPGFGDNSMLRADLISDASLQRTVRDKDIQQLCARTDDNEVVREAASMFLDELTALVEKGKADVLVCAVPFPLLKRMWTVRDVEPKEQKTPEVTAGGASKQEAAPPPDRHEPPEDFHDLLKAHAMSLGVPLQLVLPSTYDDSKRLRQVARDALRKPQDEATRAWNLYVALYYKAGGVPWRLVRDPGQLTVCYVGVSFYESLDQSALLTSTAQIFNERGEGIILRGGAATVTKEDRQPHLDAGGAEQLLTAALKAYRGEHKTQPARVVLCKTSSYSADELAGFQAALDAHDIETVDLLNVGETHTRLYRGGEYPPLRGTFLSKSDTKHVLYTRGSVDFYETYPGMYVPRPVGLTFANVASTPRAIAQELLALTKMNWNNTQFDNSEPIIVTAARKVGKILKYTDAAVTPKTRYSFYM